MLPLGLAPDCLNSWCSRSRRSDPVEPETSEKSFLFASHLDERRTGQTKWHRTFLWPRLSLLSFATFSSLWLVHHRPAGCSDLHRYHHRRFGCLSSWTPRSHPLSQTCFSSYVGGFLI